MTRGAVDMGARAASAATALIAAAMTKAQVLLQIYRLRSDQEFRVQTRSLIYLFRY